VYEIGEHDPVVMYSIVNEEPEPLARQLGAADQDLQGTNNNLRPNIAIKD